MNKANGEFPRHCFELQVWYGGVTLWSWPAIKTRHRASTSTHDILRSALCCYGNETHAPIANLPNSAQLEGTPYHSSKLHQGPCNSLGMQ